MTQAQLAQAGFVQSVLQVDEHCSVTIKNRDRPEMEFNMAGKTFSLSKQQWDVVWSMSMNIHLAFSLLTTSEISAVNDFTEVVPFAGPEPKPKKKSIRKRTINASDSC